MSSVSKALELLSIFSENRPAIGLSDICKLAGRDKATTHRHLQALEMAGMVEQDNDTKRYRLGPKILQLAQVRETTVPRKTGAQPATDLLSDRTGETAHVTILSGDTLFGLCHAHSTKHSIRAIIDIQTFPLHATASGLCALAFGPKDLRQHAALSLKSFTPDTVTTDQALDALITSTRKLGFAAAQQSFERDVHSFAAPLFDHTNRFAGTVAVACVASRCTPDLEGIIKTQLVIASQSISQNWGGEIPDHVTAIWANKPNLEPVL